MLEWWSSGVVEYSTTPLLHHSTLMFQTLQCAQLDFDDTTFLMSYPLEAPTVMASVGMIGVLQPIVVSACPCQGKYQIIAGFRRAYACRTLGLEMIHANIYPIDPAYPLPAFCLALYENLAHRRFNDVEKSLILTKLFHRFGCSKDEIIHDYMPALQLAPNEKVLEIYLKISECEEELKQYIAQHEIPLSMIELLTNLSSDDRRAMFSLISNLKIGTNKLKELLTFLDEIALRDNCSIHHILHEETIQDLLRHEKYSGPQKIEQIRQIIRKKRYPQLTTLEQEYHTCLKDLRLPRGVQVKTDRFFEDDRLTTTFRFSTPEELKTFAEDLATLAEKPELQRLLELIQGKVSIIN